MASARFGVARVKRELRAFQEVLRRSAGAPDILTILVDANDVGVAARRQEIETVLDSDLFPATVIGVPDPCVERWLLADPPLFAEHLGTQPEIGGATSGEIWKRRLVEALEASDNIVTQGGAEFAEEIIEAMHLHRAGQAEASLRDFLRDLRSALKQLS